MTPSSGGIWTRFMEGIAEEALFEFPGRTETSGRHQGAKAIRAWYDDWFRQMPSRRYTLHHVAVDRITAVGASNTVLVEWTLEETDPSGRTHVLDGVTAITIKGGRAVHLRDHVSDQQTLEELWGVDEVG